MLIQALILSTAQLLTGALGYFATPDCDVMSLAIEYFDPEHKLGLTAGSEESDFMFAAFQQIVSSVPETAHIHRRFMGDFNSHTFNSVVIGMRSFEDNTRLTSEDLDRITKAITDTPPSHCTIEEAGNTRFSSDCSYFLGDPRDGSPRKAIAFLFKYGINTLRVYDVQRGPRMIILYGDLRDPYARRDAMMRDPMYREVFGNHELDVYLPESFIGDGAWIKIESRVDRPTFESPFELRFSYGWGDCMSGCINRRDWIVRCTPLGKQGEWWKFDVRLVREEGDEVPDLVRSYLRGQRME